MEFEAKYGRETVNVESSSSLEQAIERALKMLEQEPPRSLSREELEKFLQEFLKALRVQ